MALTPKWWQGRRDDLIAAYKGTSPLYVFNEDQAPCTGVIVEDDKTGKRYIRFDRSILIGEGDIILLPASSLKISSGDVVENILLPARKVCQVKL